MSTPLEELRALVDALRAETVEQSITPERMGALLDRMIDVLPSVSDSNSLKGWVAISSINELPSDPSPTQRALAYLLDTTLYVYVGSGGDILEGKYRSAELKGTKGDTGNAGADGKDGKDGVDLGLANIVDDLETGTSTDVLSGRMGKELKGMIDNVGVKYGTYAEALDAVLASNSVFEFLLVDEVDNSDLIKPLWHINGSLVDAAGAVVSLATLTAPVFSRDSGDVYVGTTVTITCPSGSTLNYSVNGVAATSTSDVAITINEASVVKAYLKSGDAVSDIVAKSYGIAIDHKFQFKIKLTGDNSTEYVPVVASGSPKYTMTVDWGDGTTNEYSNQGFSRKGCGHTYSGTAGDEFTITLRGSAIPYLAFNDIMYCNVTALVSIIDNSLDCDTYFATNSSNSGGFNGCSSLEHLSSNALQNNLSTNIVLRNTALTAEGIEDGFFASIKSINSCNNMLRGLTLALTSSQWDEIKSMIKNCTNFGNMFYGFKGDTRIPDDFFSEVSVEITSLSSFTNTGGSPFTGDAAALYQSLLSKVSQNCTTSNAFSASSLSNRDQVPGAWGGTGS